MLAFLAILNPKPLETVQCPNCRTRFAGGSLERCYACGHKPAGIILEENL